MAAILPPGWLGLAVHLSFLLVAVLILWWAARHSVEGYEDSRGFHEGPEPTERVERW